MLDDGYNARRTPPGSPMDEARSDGARRSSWELTQGRKSPMSNHGEHHQISTGKSESSV